MFLYQRFQSTLSVRRATVDDGFRHVGLFISIHALRKESDREGRGRSGRQEISIHALRKESDASTARARRSRPISIHALRKESDSKLGVTSAQTAQFQSTLSVRRATYAAGTRGTPHYISIHALRKESDLVHGRWQSAPTISIHALRKESDTATR